MAEYQRGVHILGPTYFGTRQVGLKPDRKVMTPADMAGIKLRMPGGEAWQFLGEALGANPTPMAYAEVYTGLQTGARSEEHTSELQSLMRISYAVFCLTQKKQPYGTHIGYTST